MFGLVSEIGLVRPTLQCDWGIFQQGLLQPDSWDVASRHSMSTLNFLFGLAQ
jgi:hypothetical protein